MNEGLTRSKINSTKKKREKRTKEGDERGGRRKGEEPVCQAGIYSTLSAKNLHGNSDPFASGN